MFLCMDAQGWRWWDRSSRLAPLNGGGPPTLEGLVGEGEVRSFDLLGDPEGFARHAALYGASGIAAGLLKGIGGWGWGVKGGGEGV